MRLSAQQQTQIVEVVRPIAGEDARIVLYGSRTDDSKRGGDVDLLVEAGRALSVLDRARIKLQLENRLCLPVDVIVHTRGEPPSPFARIALATGVVLEEIPK